MPGGIVVAVPAERLASFAAERGLAGLRWIGGGLEFDVFQAVTPDGNIVALRTPTGGRFDSNANDPYVDTRALLRWEYSVTRYLSRAGVPVAKPVELIFGDPDVLVSEFVPDDGAGADQVRLGSLLRHLHGLPRPPTQPVAAEGMSIRQLLPKRVVSRWRRAAASVPGLPPAPRRDQLAGAIPDAPVGSLLHLDVRAPNLRCVDGAVRGLLDWSNALIGDPWLELGRLAEFALLPGNGIDIDAVLAGYGEPVMENSASVWMYRLDAAVMLAVVFTAEAPDKILGPRAVQRMVEVYQRFAWEAGI